MTPPSSDPAAPDSASEKNGVIHPLPPGAVGSTETGLPLFRTWGSVYVLVAGIFVLWVVLMLLFMQAFR